jgi:hypothetical protein
MRLCEPPAYEKLAFKIELLACLPNYFIEEVGVCLRFPCPFIYVPLFNDLDPEKHRQTPIQASAAFI